jgi:hypothetical protein
VPSVRRQCCIAHDGGDRTLRTHCKKSAEHLPLPSGNDACESLHLLTVLPTLAPIRIDAPDAPLPRGPMPTFRMRDSLSECYITGRCLPAMTPRVLVMGDVRSEYTNARKRRPSVEARSTLCWQMHHCLAVSVPLLRAWVHCPRATEQFVASPLCLVGYVRWDARSDRLPPLQTIIFSSFTGRTPV